MKDKNTHLDYKPTIYERYECLATQNKQCAYDIQMCLWEYFSKCVEDFDKLRFEMLLVYDFPGHHHIDLFVSLIKYENQF